MRPTSLRRERIIIAHPGGARLHRNVDYSDRIVAVLTSPQAIGVAIFCLFGLLLTAVFNLLVPNFGEVAA